MKLFVRGAWVAIIAGLVCLGFSLQPVPRGAVDIVGRYWIDRMPKSDRDAYRLLQFTGHRWQENQLVGLDENNESSYRFGLEIFSYGVDDQEVRYKFLHDNTQAATPYRVEAIPPDRDSIDLKLTLARDPRNQGQQTTFYTSTRWSSSQSLPLLLRAGAALTADLDR